MFGESQIESAEGVQQGPLLFCLAINDDIRQLGSEFNAWYLDDGTLADSADIVLSDFLYLIRSKDKLGLEINDSKCELTILEQDPILHQEIVNRFRTAAPNIRIVAETDLELLGSPLGSESMSRIMDHKIHELCNLQERIKLLDTHTTPFFS